MALIHHLLLASSITTLSARRANVTPFMVELGANDSMLHSTNFHNQSDDNQVGYLDQSNTWGHHEEVHSRSLSHQDVVATDSSGHLGEVHSQSLLDQHASATRVARLHQAPVQSHSLLDQHVSASHSDFPVDGQGMMMMVMALMLVIMAAIGVCCQSAVASDTSNATSLRDDHGVALSDESDRKPDSSGDKHDAAGSSGSAGSGHDDGDDECDDKVLNEMVFNGRLSVATAQFISNRLSLAAVNLPDKETVDVQTDSASSAAAASASASASASAG